jgi:4-amino-4-deoxy-L-arabinose transferase-like glycosyltransferase
VGAATLLAACAVAVGHVARVTRLGDQRPFGPALEALAAGRWLVAVLGILAIAAATARTTVRTTAGITTAPAPTAPAANPPAAAGRRGRWEPLAVVVGLHAVGVVAALATFRPIVGPGALLAQVLLVHPVVDRQPAGFSSAWVFSLLALAALVAAAVPAIRRPGGAVAAGTGGAIGRMLGAVRAGGPRQRLAFLAGLAVLVWAEPATELVVRQYPERVVARHVGHGYAGPALPVVIWTAAITAALVVCTLAALAWLLPRRLGGLAWFRTPNGLLGAVVGGGFLWRTVALLTVAPERTDGGDPLFYHTTANLLANGRGFIEPLNWIAYGRRIPSAIHGPLYPMWLAVSSRVGGTTYFDHKMTSILAGTGVVLVAGLIGRRVGGPWVMVVAAALAGAYPNFWIIDGVLFPEGLFVLCTGLAILAAYRWHDRRGAWTALALGVCIGLAALTRGEGLFMLGLVALPVIVLARDLPWRRRLAVLMLVGVGALLMIGPWTLRNMARFETFVPLSTNGNELHVYSNCEDTYSGKYLGFWLFDCQQRIREADGEPPGDEAQKARFWQDVGFTYAREHAGELPRVVAARVGRVWELFRPFQNVEFSAIEGRNTTAQGFALAAYYALAPAAVYGGLRLRRRRVPLLPLLAQLVSVTLTAAYAYGTIRFRAPAELTLVVLAAAGLVPLAGRLRARMVARPHRVDTGADAFVTGGPLRTRRRGTSRATAVALGAVLAVVALPLRGLYRTPGAPMEEGFMLTFPERFLRGDVPNVDFLHLYGPGSLHVLAGVYQLLGVRLEVERTVGLLQHLAIILGVYAVARGWGRTTAVVCAALATTLVLTPIGLSALAWNGAVGAALWSVVTGLRAGLDTPHRRAWAVVSGLLAGFALTYRPDVVVALALAHGYLLWRADRGHRVRVAVGAAIGLLPMWVHLAMAGPVAAFDGIVLDPVFRLRPGRELPRPPSWDHLDGALQVIAEKVPPWWEIPHVSAPKQLVLWFFVLPLMAAAVPATGWWLRRRGRSLLHARVLLAVGLFGVGLLPQALQRPDSAHFAWVSMASVPLLPVVAVELLRARRPRWHGLTRLAAATSAVMLLMLVVMPFFTFRIYLLHVRQSLGQLPPGLEVARGDRRFFLGDVPPWLASRELVADLDARARPGERLLVGPADLRQTAYSDVVFYYLFPELVPATEYIEMDPGVANAPDSGLADDVASADWLILTRFWSGWIEPNDSIVFGPDEPNVVVEEQFCLVGSYQHDLARLYQRCPGGGAPGPYEGPYDPAFDPAVEVNVPVPPRSDGTRPG